jgi:hypothetical protein
VNISVVSVVNDNSREKCEPFCVPYFKITGIGN